MRQPIAPRSSMSKVLFQLILKLSGNLGYAWAGDVYLSKQLGIPPEEVAALLEELEEQDLIRVDWPPLQGRRIVPCGSGMGVANYRNQKEEKEKETDRHVAVCVGDWDADWERELNEVERLAQDCLLALADIPDTRTRLNYLERLEALRQSPAAVPASAPEPQPDPFPVPSTPPTVARLVEHGVEREMAEALARDYPAEKIERQLTYLPHRKADRNAAGLLVRSIIKDWGPPPSSTPGPTSGTSSRDAARITAKSPPAGTNMPLPSEAEARRKERAENERVKAYIAEHRDTLLTDAERHPEVIAERDARMRRARIGGLIQDLARERLGLKPAQGEENDPQASSPSSQAGLPDSIRSGPSGPEAAG